MNNTEILLYMPKTKKKAEANIWMIFPGPEAFALSSLGYLWLFKTIDELENINIERVYTDTQRTHFNAEDIDLAGFSFTFDTDFINIFSILEKQNIPIRKSERQEKFPLIFAGGPVVTANPTPYEDFFDFFIIGDGEEANLKVINLYTQNKHLNKKELLNLISEVEGVYVPQINKSVAKLTKRLDECIYTPVLSKKAFFPNTFIMEAARGCSNRCGFCLASYLNLPFRFMPYEDLINTIELGLKYTNKIALLGAQLSAHPNFAEICNYVHKKIQNGNKIEMSVSSLRVDAITPEIMNTLVACGQRNVTLAIEAGSERLRKVINKNLTKDQIFKAVEIAKDCGLKGFKFYGMLGLPTENYDDLNEMIMLAKEIKDLYKGFDISFGFSTFIPKPNTPFQWCGREKTKLLEEKSEYIKKEMHKIGIKAGVSSAKWDYWQAVLSRGDQNLGDFVEDVYRNGGKLGAYKKSAKKYNINTDYYACENWEFNQPLAWDFIEIKPGKNFLIKENQRLLSISTNRVSEI